MKTRLLNTFILIFGFALGLTAQDHSESVTIEGVYKPHITKFDKMGLAPEVEEDIYKTPSFQVKSMNLSQVFSAEMEALSPMRLPENLPKMEGTENFVMAAFGSRISPEFLYRHYSELNKTTQIGIGVQHSSSWLNLKYYEKSSFMNNDFFVSLVKDLTDYQFSSEVFYKNDHYHYYGTIDTGDVIQSDKLKQVYNTIGLKTKLCSKKAGQNVTSFNLGAEYDLTFARTGLYEHWLNLGGTLSYMSNWFGFEKSMQILGADFDLSADILKTNRLMFTAKPYFDMKGDFFKLRLGLRMDVRTVKNDSFNFYPDIDGSLFVLNNTVQFYAGVTGGSKAYRFYEMIEENPFLNVDYFLLNSSEIGFAKTKFAFQGGARTKLIQKIDLQVDVRYSNTENQPFYVNYNDTINPINSFGLIFDNCRLFSFTAEARWKVTDSLNVHTSFVLNNYKCDSLPFAPYKAAMIWKIGAEYVMNEKILINADAVFYSRRHTLVNEDDAPNLILGGLGTEKILKPFFDLQLQANYAINEKFGAFVKVSDLLFSKYQLYYNYPVAGIQVYAGFTLCF